MHNAFALIEKSGKGYTWLAESADDKREWFEAVQKAINSNKPARGVSVFGAQVMAAVVSRPLAERIALVEAGATLMKYNQRDGKSGPRWVKITPDDKIWWGDARTKDCKSSMKLEDAIALLHGAKSSAFFKQQGAKKDHDYFCFSVVFEKRSLDFAATSAQALVDWYLALAALVPRSSEPLMEEDELRARIEGMAA